MLDPLFGVPAAAAARTLRTGGRLVNLGSSAAETSPLESAVIRSKHLHVMGYTNNELRPEQRRDALVLVAEHAAAGRLTVEHRARAADRGDRRVDPRRRRPHRPHALMEVA